MANRLFFLVSLVLFASILSCTKSSNGQGRLAQAQDDQIKRGKSVYLASCTACHSSNPTLPGAVGPDIAGSSLELLSARILRAEYPPGYKPKRSSRLMTAQPHLKEDLPALSAFLNGGKYD